MTDLFLKNIRLLSRNIISTEAYLQAKNCFVDYLSVTISGAKVFSNKTIAYIKGLQNIHGKVSVIGLNCKADMQTAALVNGMNAHVIELDDGHGKVLCILVVQSFLLFWR